MTRAPTPAQAGAGIYPDMPAEVYHSDPAPEASLSASLAKPLIFESPLHAWHKSPRLNPDFEPEDRTAFDIGKAAHTLLIGRGARLAVIDADDYRTKDAKAERDAAYEVGHTPLLREQWGRVQDMHEAALFQLERHGIGNPFARGEPEVAHFAEVDGAWCRCMTDCKDRKHRIVYDYKTTSESAHPDGATRRIANLSYDLQAAHYLDVLAALGETRWRWRFVFQESTPPYALSVCEIGEGWLDMARKNAARARYLWRTCLDRFGDAPWPGYASEINVLHQPAWAERQQLDREQMEEDYQHRTGKDMLAAAMAWQAPAGAGE